jgi:predicted RNA binding protein YcfA (HicA-like mRNA interferase family)
VGARPSGLLKILAGTSHIARQRGSHIIMVKDGEIATLSIPDHKEIAKGTLRSLIRTAGITVEEFCEQI